MTTPTLPYTMQREFLKIFRAERPERGTIGARAYALGLMIQRRREALIEEFLPYMEYSPSPDDVRGTAKTTAELTLLLIERGA